MAGDTISVSSQAWYSGAVQPAATGVTPIVNELVSLLTTGIVNMGGGKAGINTSAYINGLSTTAVHTLITNQGYNATKPKAFLNWMILDEQFALTNTTSYRGAVQVPVINAGIQKQPLTGPVNMVVQKSGYLYVYVSNESNMNVYFDDVVVNHKSGPVLEVTNFRAFGTEIATWGERAYGKLQNKYLYNGKELQSKEFSDGSGIDEYDYGMRHYDPLLGRWRVVDALSEVSRRWSVYNYCYDNPLRFMDPDGMYVSPFQRSESDSYGNEIAEKREEAKQIQAAFQMISDGWNVKHSGKNADKNSSKKNGNSQNGQSVFVLVVDGKAAGKGDVGHTALQVGEDVYGFYPTDADGDGEWDLQCSPGEMRKETRAEFDSHYEKDEITSFQIDVTDQQFANIGKALNTFITSPADYCLTGNQCTSVAADALLGAGIDIKQRTIRHDFNVIEKLKSTFPIKISISSK